MIAPPRGPSAVGNEGEKAAGTVMGTRVTDLHHFYSSMLLFWKENWMWWWCSEDISKASGVFVTPCDSTTHRSLLCITACQRFTVDSRFLLNFCLCTFASFKQKTLAVGSLTFSIFGENGGHNFFLKKATLPVHFSAFAENMSGNGKSRLPGHSWVNAWVTDFQYCWESSCCRGKVWSAESPWVAEGSQAGQERPWPLSPGSSSSWTEEPVKLGGEQGLVPSPGLGTPDAWPERKSSQHKAENTSLSLTKADRL